MHGAPARDDRQQAMPPLEIDWLAGRMHLAPTLAAWHYAEWGELLPGWTESAALEELRGHDSAGRVPTTLVALVSGRPVGSVSLVAADHQSLLQLSPWLASLYVAPAWRRLGIGAALVRRCVAEAATLGVGELFLYTFGEARFYQRLGWKVQFPVSLAGGRAIVMSIAPRAAT
jgi:predicted N-acetyltransferase YhbS